MSQRKIKTMVTLEIPRFDYEGVELTTNEIVDRLNAKETRPITWYKVKEGEISYREFKPKIIGKVGIIEANRDSGGQLWCRECGRPVSRDEPEIYFIEDGECDCKQCYDKAKYELDQEPVK